MKKGLLILLTIICIAMPMFNEIDAFVRQDSKLLVYDLTHDRGREPKIGVPGIC